MSDKDTVQAVVARLRQDPGHMEVFWCDIEKWGKMEGDGPGHCIRWVGRKHGRTSKYLVPEAPVFGVPMHHLCWMITWKTGEIPEGYGLYQACRTPFCIRGNHWGLAPLGAGRRVGWMKNQTDLTKCVVNGYFEFPDLGKVRKIRYRVPPYALRDLRRAMKMLGEAQEALDKVSSVLYNLDTSGAEGVESSDGETLTPAE